MKVLRFRRPRVEAPAGLVASVRSNRRTKNLTKRLRPGDIAVIDHADPEVFTRVREGERLRLEGDSLCRGEEVVARGTRQGRDSVEAAMERARAGPTTQLEAFAANTTAMEDRHVLIVVHAHRDGRAPGLQRLRDLGHEAVVFPVTGTGEDAAMMLADGAGAALIVVVGAHATLEEFLDKGRSGMAGTFLIRLRLGGKLVDAEGVSRLYRSRISPWALVALVAAYCSPVGQVHLTFLAAPWDAFVHSSTGLFT